MHTLQNTILKSLSKQKKDTHTITLPKTPAEQMQLRRDRYGLPGGSVWPTPGLCPGEVGRNASTSTYLCRFIENDNTDTGAGGVTARRLRLTTAMAEAEANG
ncbi:unnamed protein product [Citrullus colocynthis]|uniref:Uncharacterized protein n=1 Tax=Citrullus colocynthis TaxID=252529 RepID=A0ABP0Z0U2_9ROSI